MKPRGRIASFGLGSAISAAVTLCSWALAALGFRRLYYLGILLPLGAVLCGLAAWLLHLRDDGLVSAGRAARVEPERRESRVMEFRRGDEKGGLEAGEGPESFARLFARMDEGVLPRPAAPAEAGRGDLPARPASALVWAAAELALLAAALRAFAGIGASYFG